MENALTCQEPEPANRLPSHSVRISPRARRISLRVRPGTGLEVVIPQGADPACVPEVLLRHSRWIERALERMAGHGRGSSEALPNAFFIKGGQEEVCIQGAAFAASPQAQPGPSLFSPPVPRSIRVALPVNGKGRERYLQDLRDWVRKEALVYLGNMLETLAAEHGFSYTRLRVRYQRSRWGSCSARGNINLNACLLFLPARLTRFIVLHELCHLKVMNHSERFWKLLFSLEPDALALDRSMRSAWRYVPGWIFRN